MLSPDEVADLVSGTPILFALVIVLVRAAYVLASRMDAPHPRARALVEAFAALGPDVLRAAQQLASALLGRPLPPLDVRAHDDDAAWLREVVASQSERIAELRRENSALRRAARHALTPPSPDTPME